mgnify:CR=1 FL=1
MLGLTRKTDYALVALARLAEAQQFDGQALSARQIADQYDLPAPLLMNVMKDLQRAGVVTSTRGARGGYLLAADPDEIPLSDVIEAIEGPIALVPCCCEGDNGNGNGQQCTLEPRCPVSGPINRLQQRLAEFFQGVSLGDLLNEEIAVPLARIGIA